MLRLCPKLCTVSLLLFASLLMLLPACQVDILDIHVGICAVWRCGRVKRSLRWHAPVLIVKQDIAWHVAAALFAREWCHHGVCADV